MAAPLFLQHQSIMVLDKITLITQSTDFKMGGGGVWLPHFEIFSYAPAEVQDYVLVKYLQLIELS